MNFLVTYRLPCVQMTGIELNDKLALFYAEYRATDHLLCHDDELEGRRVAFILYLAPTWTEKDGGSLDLFAVGKIDHLKYIVPTIIVNHFFTTDE